jgi:hypothetical protein
MELLFQYALLACFMPSIMHGGSQKLTCLKEQEEHKEKCMNLIDMEIE